jgi:hypothetical protein
MHPTYYTVSDDRFFVGTIALLNSLRLTGNVGELVVCDAGLSAGSRTILSKCCTVVTPRAAAETEAVLLKPFPHFVGATGLVAVLDSDLIVTDSLEEILDEARAGRIAAFPDKQHSRQFSEWTELLSLPMPLRRQPYVNAGFVAFSTVAWPSLLRRWWETCVIVGRYREVERRLGRGPDTSRPESFAYPDQDALNALLMSEFPADALALADPLAAPLTNDREHVATVDVETLRCVHRGQVTLILHHTGGPRPWERRAWVGRYYEAFVKLLPRVLLREDVPVRLRRRDLPFWLWGGPISAISLPILHAAARAMRTVVTHLPAGPRARIRAAIGDRI